MINFERQELKTKYLFTESWMIFRSNLVVFIFIGIIVGLVNITSRSMRADIGSLLSLLKLIILLVIPDLVNKIIINNEFGWNEFIDTLKRCINKVFLWALILLFLQEFIFSALKIFVDSNIVYIKILGPLLLMIMMVIFITLYGFTPIIMILKSKQMVDAFAYSKFIAKKHWQKIYSLCFISSFILFLILFVVLSLILVLAYFFISASVYNANSITYIARDIIPALVKGILSIYGICMITLLFIKIDRYEN